MGSLPVSALSSGTKKGLGRKRTSSTMSALLGTPYLKPKDITLSESPCEVVPKRAITWRRSSCTVSVEVSTTCSACSRRACSASRSRAMPSATPPLPESGWRRRVSE